MTEIPKFQMPEWQEALHLYNSMYRWRKTTAHTTTSLNTGWTLKFMPMNAKKQIATFFAQVNIP